MTRYSLAGAEDDAPLRQRLRSDAVEGAFRLTFRREPSFFIAEQLLAAGTQVIKGVDTRSGEIVAIGSRSWRNCWVNGLQCRVGYLADLRLDPCVRCTTTLVRGYRYLKGLEQGDPIPVSITMIVDGNERAMKTITRRRAGLPDYRYRGRVLTPALFLDRPRGSLTIPGLSFVERGGVDAQDLLAFINARFVTRQFAPVVRHIPGDLVVGLRAGRIVGCASVWDQRAFRQTHIESYSPAFRLARALLGPLSRVTPLKPLPKPGESIPSAYLTHLAVEDDDAQIAAALVREVYRRHRKGPWLYLVASLHERDPLRVILSDYRSIDASGHLFTVHQEDGEPFTLDDRPPHIEAAFL